MKALLVTCLIFLYSIVLAQDIETNNIRLTPKVPAAADEMEGAIIYNAFENQFEGYDGIEWIPLSYEMEKREVLGPHSFQTFNASGQMRVMTAHFHFDADATKPMGLSNINLPVGSIITSVVAVVYDNHIANNIKVAVKKIGVNSIGQNPVISVVSEIVTSTHSSTWFEITDNLNPVKLVGETDYLSIEVYAQESDPLTSTARTTWPDDDLRFAQVRIEYTLPNP